MKIQMFSKWKSKELFDSIFKHSKLGYE